jgi:Tol biopolymer transport system component
VRASGLVLLSALLAPAQPRLQYVATAHQLGPVNYRDPLGAISPSGEWFAYSVAQHLYLERVVGGPVVELPACGGIIRHIAWLPDNRTIAIDSPEPGTRWWLYDIEESTRRPLWNGKADGPFKLESLEQMAWSADGKSIAAVARVSGGGAELWLLGADGTSGKAVRSEATLSFPAWAPDGRVACLALANGRQRLSLPCVGTNTLPDQEAYGPIAFSSDGRLVYFGAPNARGTLDLWSRPLAGGHVAGGHVDGGHVGGGPARLTQFTRDTYAPSAAVGGLIFFKQQEYRTFVASAPAEGGSTTPLTVFQSETPSFHPDGRSIGITYGNWRRIVDDFHYPDIAQDAGIVSLAGALPAREPTRIVHASKSEDQSLCWSPNGKWIAFHSHKDQSDDLWIQPADGSATPSLITHFGRGAETGWPRWSADGRSIVVDSRRRGEVPVRSVIYTIDVDQETGKTQAPKELLLDGFAEDVTHTEWSPDGRNILFQAIHFPGQQGLYSVPRNGGRVARIFAFTSEQRVPGFAVSPDGRSMAFVMPAADSFLQVYGVSMDGREVKQLTFDRSHKTQPAWSPDGKTLAFTVWNYDAHFWLLRP